MAEILISRLFKDDLVHLDPRTAPLVSDVVRCLEEDPLHPALMTSRPVQSSASEAADRSIYRSNVDNENRILWEDLGDGRIALWRVGDYTFIDSFAGLPGFDACRWESMSNPDVESAETVESQSDWYEARYDVQPFAYIPDNILRLFGVPDNQIDAVRAATAEGIWDLPLERSTADTLYNLLRLEQWDAYAALEPRNLLYRTTVDQLEGYCSGHIKQLLLNLTAEQERLVTLDMQGAVLIKGVAGSGKTTIGLYRARYLAQLIAEAQEEYGSDSRVLVLTYTQTLAGVLAELLIELHGTLPPQIEIDTFRGWMLRQLFPGLPDSEYPIATAAKRETIAGAIQFKLKQFYPDHALLQQRGSRFFLDEIDSVIRARGLASLYEYQNIDRIGRGVGLNRTYHRPLVWEFYERYQAALDAAGLVDYADLTRLAMQIVLPTYEAVVIDEAQDLTPMHLRVASRLVADQDGGKGLTLLADPAQSIYYRGISWKEAGINIRGRTRTLNRNFRNTVQILEAAKGVLDACEGLREDAEYIAPDSVNRHGPKPMVIEYDTATAAHSYVVEQIVRLGQKGQFRPGDIAILARTRELLVPLKRQLNAHSVPCIDYKHEDFRVLENKVKLITMHSAKGLEFPVVFLIELQDGVMPYLQHLRPDDDQLDALEQERKLFYVSMTRASERLYLMYPRKDRSRFIRDIRDDTVIEAQYP